MTTPDSHAKALSRRQYNNITRAQMLALGFSKEAIRHRLAVGRLHVVFRGVYADGRQHDTREAVWMAAVLRCGRGTALSHDPAAAWWGFRELRGTRIEVTIPAHRQVKEATIRIHRSRTLEPQDVTTRAGIPVTTVVRTLIDIAPRLTPRQRERAVNEADRLDLIDPETLRQVLAADVRRLHGANVLRDSLDRRTFAKTRSDLERAFLRLVRAAGLPMPLTQQMVNGFEVDFYWPALGLVVECDGLRYHRTPAQQARDRLRDQAHIASGLIALRFTGEQVAHEPDHVISTLAAVARRVA
jgi:very-short-patch-repair endonuclease